MSPARRGDRTWILEAENETARLTYGRDPSDSERAQRRAALQKALTDPRSNVVTARDDADRLGYYWLEERSGPIAYLLDFWVAPQFRRRGVASDMLRAVIQDARDRGCAELRFVTSQRNGAAVAFFLQAGARRVNPSASDINGLPEYVLPI